MPRHYYAGLYPYGSNMYDDNNRVYRAVYRFKTADARDAWVYAGQHDYYTNSDYREEIGSRTLTRSECLRAAVWLNDGWGMGA